MYQLTQFSSVIRLTDGATIPADPDNADWQVYLRWLSNGNTPDPVPAAVVEGVARAERDALLRSTDVHALADRWASMTTSEQQAWAAYRQALRDVPQQPGFPQNIIWPVAPA